MVTRLSNESANARVTVYANASTEASAAPARQPRTMAHRCTESSGRFHNSGDLPSYGVGAQPERNLDAAALDLADPRRHPALLDDAPGEQPRRER